MHLALPRETSRTARPRERNQIGKDEVPLGAVLARFVLFLGVKQCRASLLGKVCLLDEEDHTSEVSVEESSVARKRVWTYERPPQGTSAATRPLHAHRREEMVQIARGAAAVRPRSAGESCESAAAVDLCHWTTTS